MSSLHTLEYAHQPTLGGVICDDTSDGGVSIRVLPSRGRKLRAAVQHVLLVSFAILVPFSVICTQWTDWMRHSPSWWALFTLLLALSGIGLVWSSLVFASTFFPVFIHASHQGLATTSGRGLFARHRAWPASEIDDVYMARVGVGQRGGMEVQLRTRAGFVHPLVDAPAEEATYIAQRLCDALGGPGGDHEMTR